MSKIGDAEDIFTEAQSYIECVRLAACQLEHGEESDAIAAVAMAAYLKIGEGITLLDECPEVRKLNEAERKQLREDSPVPPLPSAKPGSRAPQAKRSVK